ncbi:hypothetical protein LguiB_025862 [Lonicera macranthoides]
METLDPTAGFVMDDDLLNFSLDDEDDDEKTKLPSSSLDSLNPDSQDDQSRSFTESVEEELEWLSNKDAFPGVETCLDILAGNPCSGSVLNQLNHKSPVSVLENRTTTPTIMSCCGTFQVPVRCPVKPRSKKRRRGRRVFPDLPAPKSWRWSQESALPLPRQLPPQPPSGAGIGRRCQHCLAEKTPQWRAGPMGPKTLCNACGVRYKSGRLVPEYRPASSPTFSSELHSNSHRKIMEMRRQSHTGEIAAKGYRVG